MNENGKAKIQVEDNGPGICDEMKPRIFEMFYTGEKYDRRQPSKSWFRFGTLPFDHRGA